VLARASEIDGNLYHLLDPAARLIEGKHPLAATLLRRAMIEDTLDGAKSTRYKHAARHLLECRSLAAGIPGLRDVRDARRLRQPPARQARPEDRLLEPGERGVRGSRLTVRLGPLADGHFAQLRGHWACSVLNQMTRLGMPVSQRIA
jgi:hypothetical protein